VGTPLKWGKKETGNAKRWGSNSAVTKKKMCKISKCINAKNPTCTNIKKDKSWKGGWGYEKKKENKGGIRGSLKKAGCRQAVIVARRDLQARKKSARESLGVHSKNLGQRPQVVVEKK